MQVDGPEESAAMIRGVLDGQPGPAAGHRGGQRRRGALAGPSPIASRGACAQLAAEAIDSGAARDLLARLAEKTRARNLRTGRLAALRPRSWVPRAAGYPLGVPVCLDGKGHWRTSRQWHPARAAETTRAR